MAISRNSWSALTIATMVAGSSVVVDSASAQHQRGEVLLGAIRAGSSHAAMPADNADGAYGEAMRALREGDVAGGQHQLEQLVARWPASGAAVRARQELARLYTADAAPKAPPAVEEVSYLGAREAGQPAPTAAPTVSPWRTTVRPLGDHAKSPQERLRETAGDLVFFSEGSADLGARARKALAAQAQWLAREPAASVTIEGHADEPGSPSELVALSQARADVVRTRLIEEGVDPGRIRTMALGAARPVALCADTSCAAQNRRAITLLGGTTAAQAPLRPAAD